MKTRSKLPPLELLRIEDLKWVLVLPSPFLGLF